MASKKCPSCGKKVVAEARFCLYCNYRFPQKGEPQKQPVEISPKSVLPDKAGGESSRSNDRDAASNEIREAAGEVTREVTRVIPTNRAKRAGSQKKARYMRIFRTAFLSVLVVAVVVIAVASVIRHGGFFDRQPNVGTPDPDASQPTTEPSEDPFLHGFLGQWVDEQSVGKGNIPVQGGGVLIVLSVRGDIFLFDLLSYSGGEDPQMAFLRSAEGTVNGNEVNFSFEDDGFGNAGRGKMLLSQSTVDMEIAVTDPAEPQTPHSLAMNARFVRSDLPQASGIDVLPLTTIESVSAVAGEETAEILENADGTVTRTFGILRVTATPQGQVRSLEVTYSDDAQRTKYRYDRVDGTSDYTVIKTYFGQAEHDYTEQPTNIRVLDYTFPGKEVSFVFNAGDDRLYRTTVTYPAA